MGRACGTNEAKRNAYGILASNPEGKRPLGRPRLGGWLILKWILERWDEVMWTGFLCLRIRTSEHGNETSGSVKC
jgi:hypothetical protein